MVKRGIDASSDRPRRFTVSVSPEDYEKLKELADSHKPRLTLQYVVNYAIRLLLEQAEDPQLRLTLGNPTEPSRRLPRER
jgi:hypothetical protein